MMALGNNKIPLGKQIPHSSNYDPSHLFPVPRIEGRKELNLKKKLSFSGVDIWNCYELSWLDLNGKPCIAVGTIIFPCTSENIIESKSMKLYFNSLNQTKFKSHNEFQKTISDDLSNVSGDKVETSLLLPENFRNEQFAKEEGICIDSHEIKTDKYSVDTSILKCDQKVVSETLYSNLLRTNCPVTGQPDWGTVIIEYSGKKINQKSLLKYITSFRNHTGFHENCVEKIFTDLKNNCKTKKLSVQARFTRRGGIDINPCRSDFDKKFLNLRSVRQ